MGKIKNRRLLKKYKWKTILKQLRVKPDPFIKVLTYLDEQIRLAITGRE